MLLRAVSRLLHVPACAPHAVASRSSAAVPSPGCRVICSSTGPTTLMVSLLFTILFLHNIQQLHGEGLAPLVPSLTFLLGYLGWGLASHRAERVLGWLRMAGAVTKHLVVDIIPAAWR